MSFAGYAVGDVVRLIDTVTIVGKDGDRLRCEDVKNKQRFWVIGSDAFDSSLKIEMVKKAVKPVAVGDTISGKQVSDVQWKRGAIIRATCQDHLRPHEGALILFADGKWHEVDGDCFGPYTFEELNQEASFRVLSLGWW